MGLGQSILGIGTGNMIEASLESYGVKCRKISGIDVTSRKDLQRKEDAGHHFLKKSGIF
jgi:hypothetical protein